MIHTRNKNFYVPPAKAPAHISPHLLSFGAGKRFPSLLLLMLFVVFRVTDVAVEDDEGEEEEKEDEEEEEDTILNFIIIGREIAQHFDIKPNINILYPLFFFIHYAIRFFCK